jgi:hypothetical protein
MDNELLKYVIERMDERFNKLESKVDELLAFKYQIIGGSVLVSIIATLIIDYLFR